MGEFSALEKQVIEHMLVGHEAQRSALRFQLAVATVSSREFSGVGVFTNIAVASSAPPAPELGGMQAIARAHVECGAVPNGLGFILWTRDGVLASLEGFTYGDEPWPEETGDCRFIEAKFRI